MKYQRAIESTFKVSGRTGAEFLVMCPFHSDTSNGHMYVNAVKGVYLCMSCGAKGHLDRLDIQPASAEVHDVKERIAALRSSRKSPVYYPEGWLDQFDIPHPYWTENRRLDANVVKRFRLGWDPITDRMTMPIRDVRGRLFGVCYRRLDDRKPKYLNPKGYPIGRHLYGAWLLTGEPKVAVVEGQMDVIRGWASRVPTLGLLRSQITADQVKVMQRLGVIHAVLMLDNDAAGYRGTISTYEMLRGNGIRVSVGWYRPYWNVKDPDDLSPQRYRKMFHSSLKVSDWGSMMNKVV